MGKKFLPPRIDPDKKLLRTNTIGINFTKEETTIY
jgi:hypothetical protein